VGYLTNIQFSLTLNKILRQDFRITAYINYAYSSLLYKTIAKTMDLLWDLFALNNYKFSPLSHTFYVRHILEIDETSDVNNSTRTTTNACDYKNVIAHATRVWTRELIAMFELASHVCKVAFRPEFFRALSTEFKENYLFGRNTYS